MCCGVTEARLGLWVQQWTKPSTAAGLHFQGEFCPAGCSQCYVQMPQLWEEVCWSFI